MPSHDPTAWHFAPGKAPNWPDVQISGRNITLHFCRGVDTTLGQYAAFDRSIIDQAQAKWEASSEYQACVRAGANLIEAAATLQAAEEETRIAEQRLRDGDGHYLGDELVSCETNLSDRRRVYDVCKQAYDQAKAAADRAFVLAAKSLQSELVAAATTHRTAVLAQMLERVAPLLGDLADAETSIRRAMTAQPLINVAEARLPQPLPEPAAV